MQIHKFSVKGQCCDAPLPWRNYGHWPIASTCWELAICQSCGTILVHCTCGCDGYGLVTLEGLDLLRHQKALHAALTAEQRAIRRVVTEIVLPPRVLARFELVEHARLPVHDHRGTEGAESGRSPIEGNAMTDTDADLPGDPPLRGPLGVLRAPVVRQLLHPLRQLLDRSRQLLPRPLLRLATLITGAGSAPARTTDAQRAAHGRAA